MSEDFNFKRTSLFRFSSTTHVVHPHFAVIGSIMNKQIFTILSITSHWSLVKRDGVRIPFDLRIQTDALNFDYRPIHYVEDVGLSADTKAL